MNKFITSRHLFAFVVLGLVLLVAACGSNSPTSTPVPPTSNAPTALPPAPTAPPLTEAPTPIPPTAAPTAVIPTDVPAPTTVLPTDTPAPTNTTTSTTAPTQAATRASSGTTTGTGTGTGSGGATAVSQGPLTGLYITALRFDPTYPVKNTPIMFYATLINKTGKDQNYPICAEIFRPGAGKSFGITNCDTGTIVPGTSEIFIGSWIATGIKECIPVRARAVLHELDTDNVRLVLPTTSGGELWTDFNMCP